MLKVQLEKDLKKIVEDLGYSDIDTVCDIPRNPGFGDYSSNILLQLAKLESSNGKQTPQQIANEIISNLGDLSYLSKAEVAGVGFLNFWLKPQSLMENLQKVCNYTTFVEPQFKLEDGENKKILIEFGQTNTLKAFHIGHLFNLIVGDSVARILHAAGNDVFRVNYQGDIGLHVAKAIWVLQKTPPPAGGPAKNNPIYRFGDILGQMYAKGAKAFDQSEEAKKEINEINTKLYKHEDKDLEDLWQKTRQMSLDYYQWVYQTLSVKYDKLIFESEVAELGKKIVLDNVGKVFKKDQGAIIFAGSEHSLHNRVFITSAGNPTYEAKEMGAAEAAYQAFPYDLGIHVVDRAQTGYFEVTFKALEILDEKFKGKKLHIQNGTVGLKGKKMSSRTGDVVTFNWLLEEVKERIEKIMQKSTKKTKEKFEKGEMEQVIDTISIGAIKFAMLKYSPTTNIIFDLEKSVALDGDSGPYVQYTYARAKSILRNASYAYQPNGLSAQDFEKEERLILQKLEYFPVFICEAASKYQPNTVANYLLVLARLFNLFYQKHPVINSGDKSELRLALTCAVAVTIRQGLYLLGIETVERM